MQPKNDDFIYYNELLKNWKLNLSETGIRRFLLFLSDDLRIKSMNNENNTIENKIISKICFLEVNNVKNKYIVL